MRSRNDAPGSCVISTTMRSESTRVPPVTALRSPPDSRMTGADSPVIADSSTEAMPSITVPSPGISSPASTTTTSPRASSAAGRRVPSASVATVSLRIARKRRRLGLAAALGDRLGEVAEEHGEPQPGGDGEREPAGLAGLSDDPEDRGEQRAQLDHEHDGVADHRARVQLAGGHGADAERRSIGRRVGAGGGRVRVGHRDASRSSARFSSSTLTDFGPASPRNGRLAWSSTSASTRSSGIPRSCGHAGGLDAGVGLGDVRVHARGRRRHRVGRDPRRRQARGERALAAQVPLHVLLQLRRQLLLVRALVGEERRVRRVAGDRRAALEVLGVLREVLPDQAGADDLAAGLDHRAVGAAGERQLGGAGHHERVGEAERHGEDDDGHECGSEFAHVSRAGRRGPGPSVRGAGRGRR